MLGEQWAWRRVCVRGAGRGVRAARQVSGDNVRLLV